MKFSIFFVNSLQFWLSYYQYQMCLVFTIKYDERKANEVNVSVRNGEIFIQF